MIKYAVEELPITLQGDGLNARNVSPQARLLHRYLLMVYYLQYPRGEYWDYLRMFTVHETTVEKVFSQAHR